MTPIYSLTEASLKKTGRDMRVLPKTVIYDSRLTVSLPASLSVTSGINAIAHAAEGLYAQDANPVVSLMAEEGIRALAQGIGRVVVKPDDLDTRSDCLYGAWLCGAVFGSVGMSLHHKLCIRSAARSICRMLRRTRSFCRTRSRTTAMRRPMR